MALTKKQRDALADEDFAVPETRDLPMQDKSHVSMAWKMLDNTKGLSDEQRKTARERILKKAKDLGMDTSDWSKDVQAAPDANDPYPDKGNLKDTNIIAADDSKSDDEPSDDEKQKREMEKEQEEKEDADARSMHGMQSMSLSALALEFPEPFKDHPNQMPFKGVLTRLDEPSDNPLNGSDGKCVILPSDIAEEALPTLIGMAVDYTPNFDGHDVKSKIGLITEANVVGNEITIAGYFYSADFPDEVKRIQAEKARLGFSFEAQALVKSMNDNPLVIKSCVFTGAAVLYKDKAAYTTTSLSAQKMESETMDKEILELIKNLQTELAGMKTEMKASAEATKLAAASVMDKVKPHADALRSCANGMAAAGIGMHASQGHVAVLNKMADHMESRAALGEMPHIYQMNDFYHAGADKTEKVEVKASAEVTDALKAITDKLAAVESKLVDQEKARFEAASAPERKTIAPAMSALLAKAGIKHEKADEKVAVIDIDKQLAASNASLADRFAAKVSLLNQGKLA